MWRSCRWPWCPFAGKWPGWWTLVYRWIRSARIEALNSSFPHDLFLQRVYSEQMCGVSIHVVYVWLCPLIDWQTDRGNDRLNTKICYTIPSPRSTILNVFLLLITERKLKKINIIKIWRKCLKCVWFLYKHSWKRYKTKHRVIIDITTYNGIHSGIFCHCG